MEMPGRQLDVCVPKGCPDWRHTCESMVHRRQTKAWDWRAEKVTLGEWVDRGEKGSKDRALGPSSTMKGALYSINHSIKRNTQVFTLILMGND